MTRLKNITLYHRPTCPFCIRVRLFLAQNNIHVEEKNVSVDYEAQTTLIQEGGKRQVPAISIQDNDGNTSWLYESGDIIQYLKNEQRKQAA